jgi:hypothetical protein
MYLRDRLYVMGPGLNSASALCSPQWSAQVRIMRRRRGTAIFAGDLHSKCAYRKTRRCSGTGFSR